MFESVVQRARPAAARSAARHDSMSPYRLRGARAPRPQAGRVRPHRRAARPRAEPHRARHLLGDVVRALQLQELARPSARRCRPTGPRVLQGPGENAGAVDIGDGLAAVFKIESHNHPSFIEPYQGAATGVGGIIRDIFTMGARPIALLNSLRFGPLDDAAATPPHRRRRGRGHRRLRQQHRHPDGRRRGRVRRRLRGQSAGQRLLPRHREGRRDLKGVASGVGNPVFYVGAKTGRDGIHGATMASAEFDDKSAEKRPAVQVGDPFMEKLLLEACLEVMQTDALVGIQDMGAAGLTCSTCEMGVARRRRHRDRRRARAAARDRHDAVRDHALRIAGAHAARRQAGPRGRGRGDLREVGSARRAHRRGHRRRHAARARTRRGRRRDSEPARSPTRRRSTTGRWRRRRTSTTVAASRRSTALASAADRRRRAAGAARRRRPSRASAGSTASTTTWCAPTRSSCRAWARASCGSRARRGRWRMSTDGNGRYCYLDPRRGAMLAVAEAARNVACAGARPIGATNCLNFGNPERPEIMWQFAEAVEGHRRGVPRARHADHRRQRQPLQRDRRPGDLSDAGHRRRRPDRGRRRVRDAAVQAAPATRSCCSATVAASLAAANT